MDKYEVFDSDGNVVEEKLVPRPPLPITPEEQLLIDLDAIKVDSFPPGQRGPVLAQLDALKKYARGKSGRV